MESANKHRRPITRTRTGCQPCRRRRLKCDENKPICRTCFRSGIHCDFRTRFVFRDDTAAIRDRVTRSEQEKWEAIHEMDNQNRSHAAHCASSGTDPTGPDVIDGSGRYLSAREKRHARSVLKGANYVPTSNESTTSGDGSSMNIQLIDAILEDGTIDGSDHELSNTSPENSLALFDGLGLGTPPATAETLVPSLDKRVEGDDAAKRVFHNHASTEEDSTPGGSDVSTSLGPPKSSLTPWVTPGFTNVDDPSGLTRISFHAAIDQTPLTRSRGNRDSGVASENLENHPECANFATHIRPGPAMPESTHDLSNDSIELSINASIETQMLNQWRNDLLPQLPPVFTQIDRFITDYAAVRFAVFALATAKNPQFGTFNGNSIINRTALQQKECKSLAYYSYALSTFAASGPSGVKDIEICAKLAVLLLFTYIELGSGTVHGRICHLRGFDNLVQTHYDEIIQSTNGIHLIIVWAGLRAQHVADCFAFSPGPFATLFEGSVIQADVDRYIQLTSSSYQLLISCLATVTRTSQLLLLFNLLGPDTSSPIYRRWVALMAQIGNHLPQHSLPTSHQPAKLIPVLELQRNILDTWETSLPLSQRPIDSFSSNDLEPVGMQYACLRVRPLRFADHQAAMNYLRYCCAQLYASRRVNESYGKAWPQVGNREPMGDENGSSWALLALRVVAGLDIQTCLIGNVYHVGVIWILVKIALRCESIEIITWIDDYTAKMQAQGGVEEGGLSIGIARRALARMIKEWENGRMLSLFYTSLDQFREKQELCGADSSGLQIQSVLHGITRPGNKSGASLPQRPFVDIVDNL